MNQALQAGSGGESTDGSADPKPRTLGELFRTSTVVELRSARTALDFESLRRLADDWDGAGADRPTIDAISRAESIVGEVLNAVGRSPSEIDPDVLGGVALYYFVGDATVWVSVRNGMPAVVAVLGRPFTTRAAQDGAAVVAAIESVAYSLVGAVNG